MNEWKPFETAPKDGRHFVALTDYGLPCVMQFSEYDNNFVRSVTCRRCDGFGLARLIHWTDLPDMPTNKAGEEGW